MICTARKNQLLGWLLLPLLLLVTSTGCEEWCKRNYCPDTRISTESQSPQKTKLILQHECVGAWGPITNKFDRNVEPDSSWNGFLFQLGAYYPLNELYPEFKEISFQKNGKVVKILKSGDFKWLNIWANPSDVSPLPSIPIRYKDHALLDPNNRPTGDPKMVCDVVNLCSEECKKDPNCSEEACYVVGESSTPGFIPEGCLRLQRLHPLINPVAIVTYWYWDADDGVQIKTKGSGNHVSFEFELGPNIKIEVDGTTLPELENVDQIFIYETEHDIPSHGDHDDPPWGGRSTGP